MKQSNDNGVNYNNGGFDNASSTTLTYEQREDVLYVLKDMAGFGLDERTRKSVSLAIKRVRETLEHEAAAYGFAVKYDD